MRRRAVACLLIIRRHRAELASELARWNERWNAFSMVGGHKQETESFRECVSREIYEEKHDDETRK